jgi:hypothetical protein
MTEDQKAVRDVLVFSAALLLFTGVFMYIGLIG